MADLKVLILVEQLEILTVPRLEIAMVFVLVDK